MPESTKPVPTEPTPGQVAYEAWRGFFALLRSEWVNLDPNYRAAWEAAAQAVRQPLREELRDYERRSLRAMEILDSHDYASRLNQLDSVREALHSFQEYSTIEQESLGLGEENKRLRAALERFRWIPVSERLPETGAFVLGWDQDYSESCKAEWDGRLWFDSNGSRSHITRWMPLPDPPEQAREALNGGADG